MWLFLDRIKKYDPQLHFVITITEDLAMEQAQRADAEIAAGNYRGMLHGIPYGAKDLLSTKKYKTTWGAAPYQDQVIDEDASVIQKLEEAGAVFGLNSIGKAAARLDFDKLSATNGHYIRNADQDRLFKLISAEIEETTPLNAEIHTKINAALPHLLDRGNTIPELAAALGFLTVTRPLELNKKARKSLRGEALDRLALVRDLVSKTNPWEASALKLTLQAICEDHDMSIGQIGPPIRAALTGGLPAPDIDQVMEWLGREECLSRMNDRINAQPA